jgi:catechol 2,3-dioxygenase-like lactoylglutathione lyase family enzyme
MAQHLGLVAIVVRDYDEALAFYTGKLGFELVEDAQLSPEKRWVVVSPPGAKETRLLLARAANGEQRDVVGRQGGGRVSMFLYTDDIRRDYALFLRRGVRFTDGPHEEAYGTYAVFEDL